MSKRKILSLSLILFCLFLATTYLVGTGRFGSIDRQITILFQSLIGRSLDVPLSFFSLLASSEIIMIILAVIAALVYFRYKKVFFGLGLIFAVYFFELIGKFFIYHPGPPKEFFRYDLPFVFPSAYVHTNYSFPSGHVSRTFFIAVILFFIVKKLGTFFHRKYFVSCLLFVVCSIMVVSRIYLGEHWFSDVLGGIFLGSSLGLLAFIQYHREIS